MSLATRTIAAVTCLAVAVVVAGCAAASEPSAAQASARASTVAEPGPSATATPVTGPSAATSPSASGNAAATAPPSPNPAVEALAGRPWATATLTDVATNQPFSISDFAGRTVFIESMAIWCTNCRAQQNRFEEALGQLDPDTVAYVVLTVDPSESAEELARYRERNGFSGTYAVAGREVAQALVDEFGPNAINPPTVPLVRVTPGGEVVFETGGESVDEIVSLAGG